MSLVTRLSLLSFSAVAIAATALTATQGVAADKPLLMPSLVYDLGDAPGAITAPAPIIAAPPAPAPLVATIDDAELDCLAKVVHHEARNQPRHGQLAVAHVLTARRASGRFATSICAVANQRGQFFNTAAYKPDRTSATWQEAVAVARETLTGDGDTPTPGAMFFRAAYQPANSFFRSRQRVATVGDHVFYR